MAFLGLAVEVFEVPWALVRAAARFAGGLALPVLVLVFAVTTAPRNAAAKFGTQGAWARFVPRAQVFDPKSPCLVFAAGGLDDCKDLLAEHRDRLGLQLSTAPGYPNEPRFNGFRASQASRHKEWKGFSMRFPASGAHPMIAWSGPYVR